jgi:hypothetical protein
MIPIFPVGFPNNIDQNSSGEVIFQDETGYTLKRTGHCSRCGNCCDDIENIFAELDGNNDPNPLVQVVPGKCAYFRWMEDGLAGCVGRDTLYYKNGCNVWPTIPQHIQDYPDCTFKFEVVDNGN